MRNLRIALVTCLLLTPLAFAEWRDIPGVTGAPLDVWIWDAGVFAAHTTATAYKLEDVPGGPVGVVPPTLPMGSNSWSGSYLDSTGCLVAVSRSGRSVDCASVTVDLMTLTDTQSAFRATPRYAGYATGLRASSTPDQFFAPVGTLRTPGSLARLAVVETLLSSPWISATSVGANEYLLIGSLGTAFLVENTTMLPGIPAFSLSATGSDLSVGRDGGIRGVLTRDSQGRFISYDGVSVTAVPFTVVPAPGIVRSIAYREGAGDQYGEGWGMALVDPSVIYSAIPDPAAPAQTWVPSTLQPPNPSAGTWNVIRCLNAEYCVLASSTATGGRNLISYRNANPPAFDRPLAFGVDEGTSSDLVVDAGDPDGDAVFVTWSFDAGFGGYFSVGQPSPDGKGLTITAAGPNPNLCGVASRTVLVDVSLSDGLASHATVDSGTVMVVHTIPPEDPTSVTYSFDAGGPAGVVDAPQKPGVCQVQHAFVRTDTTALPDISPLGTSAPDAGRTFTPPATWCSADAGISTYEVRATDGVLFSDAGVVRIEVQPWGAPLAPFSSAAATLIAGDAGTYGPAQTHVCQMAPDFTGVDTLWTWTSNVPDASVLDSAGNPLAMGAASGTVTVRTVDCTQGQVVFDARNRTRTGAIAVGPGGQLTVDVVTVLSDIRDAGVTLTGSSQGSQVVGQVDVAGLNCPGLRGLTAGVLLRYADGGAVISSGDAGVGLPFQLAAPGACNGGRVALEATVREADGGAASAQPLELNLPNLSAGVEGIAAQEFTVTCGGPATMDASVILADGGCDSAGVRWTAAGAFPILPASGPQAMLETVDQDFGRLIGQTIEVIATADAGLGNAGSLQVPFRVVPDRPFVTVTHRASTPVASESRLLSMEVTLTNTSACPVGEVELRESLEGMSWLLGSVRVNGVEVAAQIEPGDGGLPELVVPGLFLDAGASVTLSYSARPALLGKPSPRGRAELRQVPVSVPAGLTAGSPSCGCSSGGLEGPALLGLLGLLARALGLRRGIRGRS